MFEVNSSLSNFTACNSNKTNIALFEKVCTFSRAGGTPGRSQHDNVTGTRGPRTLALCLPTAVRWPLVKCAQICYFPSSLRQLHWITPKMTLKSSTSTLHHICNTSTRRVPNFNRFQSTASRFWATYNLEISALNAWMTQNDILHYRVKRTPSLLYYSSQVPNIIPFRYAISHFQNICNFLLFPIEHNVKFISFKKF